MDFRDLFVSPESEGGLRHIGDLGGFIPTRQEWDEIALAIDAWYDGFGDDAIRAHNRSLWEAVLSRMDPSLAPGRPSERTRRPRRHQAGFIYVVAGNGYYKIGRSVDVPNRLRAFGLHLPFPTELVCWFAVDDTHASERSWHQAFADKRVNGEWFDLDAEDLALLKSSAGVTVEQGVTDE